jgi:hypothetical protein
MANSVEKKYVYLFLVPELGAMLPTAIGREMSCTLVHSVQYALLLVLQINISSLLGRSLNTKYLERRITRDITQLYLH